MRGVLDILGDFVALILVLVFVAGIGTLLANYQGLEDLHEVLQAEQDVEDLRLEVALQARLVKTGSLLQAPRRAYESVRLLGEMEDASGKLVVLRERCRQRRFVCQVLYLGSPPQHSRR
jgi:hypothetical protein